jgi:hypothetical protein
MCAAAAGLESQAAQLAEANADRDKHWHELRSMTDMAGANHAAWKRAEQQLAERDAELAALKGHAEAMATTLDDWSRIDQCPCVALDNYRAEFKTEEPKP